MPANGLRTLRMSKKNHDTMRRDYTDGSKCPDIRGDGYSPAKNTGLDNGQIIENVKEARPFGSSTGKYPLTPQAKSAEEVDSGKEGRIRGRQADKHAK